MSRRGHFASTAQNAPFGTDIQRQVKTRIVGGKVVEVGERTPQSSAGSQGTSVNLQLGPHGTPPMQYQPPVRDPAHNNYSSPDVVPLPDKSRKVYSQTATRDSSNSHIHSKGTVLGERHGAPKPLPPISGDSNHHHHQGDDADTWSDSTSTTDNPLTIKELLQKPFPVQLRTSPALSPIGSHPSLPEQVAGHLARYDPLHFREMYTDLAEFDHGLRGFVSQPQMNMIAHKHKLPIPLETLRLLFANFAKGSNPDMVNYEKLIQFLARAQLGSAEAETLLQESVNKFVQHEAESNHHEHSSNRDGEVAKLDAQIRRYEEAEETERRHKQQEKEKERQIKKQKEQWKPSFEPKKPLRTFSELDDAKLIRMLEEQFTDGKKKQTIDLDGMREMCLKRDRHQQGTFSRKDLDDLFLFHRIPVQGSLLNKMIQRIDTGDGQLSWVAFLEILGRVDSGDALTPRGEKPKPKEQRRASDIPPVRTHAPPGGQTNSLQNPNMSGSGTGRDGSGTRSRDGTKSSSNGLRPLVEPSRPSTWPKRPIKEVLPTPQDPKKVASPPWLRKPLARIDKTQAEEDKDVTDVEMEITRNDTPTDEHVTPSPPPTAPTPVRDDYEIDQLRHLAQHHQHHRPRGVEQRESAVRREKRDKMEREEWFKGFLHLAKGLYNTDASKTGCLYKAEILRLINNYNLIYQLGLTSSHIKRVVDACCHEGDEVPIQPVLEILRQKKK